LRRGPRPDRRLDGAAVRAPHSGLNHVTGKKQDASDFSDVEGNVAALLVLLSSVLFGLIHTEQDIIGVVLTFLDGLFLSWLRLHFRSLWAPVLAHGANNTIGLITFFVLGPAHGLW